MPKGMSTDKVREWLADIRLGLKWREPYEEVWMRTIDYLRGQYLDEAPEEDKICINMVRPHVSVVIPAIYSKNPDLLVYPKKLSKQNDELARKRAETVQNVLRYQIREIDLKTEVKLAILDGIICGHAWAKTGYDTIFSPLTDEEKETETLVSRMLRMLGIKEKEVTEDEYYSLHQRIVSEKAWAVRTSPFDIIVPALSRRPESLDWIANRFILPYDDVMEDPELSTKGLKPSVTASELLKWLKGSNYKDIPQANEKSFVILYEVYSRKTKECFILAEDHDDVLQQNPSGYTFLDSLYHPYVMLRMNEVNDEFYPQSDIEPAEPQLLELNDVRTQMNKHRKRYNRRYLSKPGALDPSNKELLETGEDGAVIETTSDYEEQPIGNVLVPISDAPLPPEVYAVETRIKDDLFTILGTSDYASSASGGARTATEASIIAQQSRFRVEERIDAIGKFTEQIIRNIALIMMRYATQEQITQIIGDDAIFWEQLFDDDELRAEYKYEVIYGSSTPVNRDIDREQFIKFYSLVREDPYFNQIKLRLEFARKFMLENPESWLDPKIAQIIEQQRLAAAQDGRMLAAQLQGPLNASEPGRVPNPNRLPTGQPQGLPGDIGGSSEPEIPGGRGGTNLASAGV